MSMIFILKQGTCVQFWRHFLSVCIVILRRCHGVITLSYHAYIIAHVNTTVIAAKYSRCGSCDERYCWSTSVTLYGMNTPSCHLLVTCCWRAACQSSAADPLPTPILKEVADVVAPFVSELFNRSLYTGYFSTCFKEAFITPVIKKPGLDAADANSYRPIWNLSVISKLLERVIV